MVSVLSLTPFARDLARVPRLGTHYSRDLPAPAVRFLDQQGVTGHVFNELQFGCFLAYARPTEPVFLDGRLTVYGPDFLARFERAKADPEALRMLLSDYRIDYAILRHPQSAHSVEVECHRFLVAQAGFVPVHVDDACVVYVSRDSAFRDVASRFGLYVVAPLDPVGSAMALRPGTVTELERLLGQAPDSVRLLTSVGIARAKSGSLAEGLDALERAVELSPDSSISWWALAEARLGNGDPQEALSAAERAVALAPESPAAQRIRARALRALERE
jgi:tetratricopeptide (TPR) repeat protein